MRSPLAVSVLGGLVLLSISGATGAGFHFTVTADPCRYHTDFANVLGAIAGDPVNWEGNNPLVTDYGAFHVSIGDIDGTIAQNREVIDAAFGPSALWYPVIGNHEAVMPVEMTWLRNEYQNGNGVRIPLRTYTNQNGPATCIETTYAWDHANAHFVVLNQYWDGASDTGTDGDIVSALRQWLAWDLAANTRPFVFVFGHEPAFPYVRHVGDSLDQYPGNRDAFWGLLEAEHVPAYFCAHTHFYSQHRGDENHLGEVWQIDVGNAGFDMGDGKTFLDVTVEADEAVINVYRDFGDDRFSLADSITVVPEPATVGLMGLGLVAVLVKRRRK